MSKFKGEINKILIAIKKGNARAKEALFDRTYAYLKTVAWKYVYDKNALEDVLQNAYLRIFAYVHTFDESKDGYNWLCRIVQNEAWRYNKENPPVLPLNEDVSHETWQETDDSLLERLSLYEYLRVYSPTDQKLIYYKYYEQLSYAEIAKKMGMKKSNVHKRVSKILRELSQRIEHVSGVLKKTPPKKEK